MCAKDLMSSKKKVIKKRCCVQDEASQCFEHVKNVQREQGETSDDIQIG